MIRVTLTSKNRKQFQIRGGKSGWQQVGVRILPAAVCCSLAANLARRPPLVAPALCSCQLCLNGNVGESNTLR